MSDDNDPRVTALARDVERANRRVDNLERLVRVLAGDVTKLGAATPASQPVDGMRAWLLGRDPEQAGTDLGDLVEWLAQVYRHYPHGALPSCWLWHPWAVEELWWLRNAHVAAYAAGDGSWMKAADWHDRLRPGVAKRIHNALSSCELALHTAGAEQARPPTVVPLSDHARQIAQTWTTRSEQLEPTPSQLDEAKRHDHEQLRTSTR